MSNARGIRDRVAVIGMGCTKFGGHWDKSRDDLIVEAVRAEVAKEFRSDTVYVKTFQVSVSPSEGEFRADYDLTTVKSTGRAAEAAYAEAGYRTLERR